MTLSHRRILRYIAFALFFLVGAYLVANLRGFVFDTETFRFVRVGGMYIRHVPTDADLIVDGIRKTSLLSFVDGGTFLADLRPDNYVVRITKNGYTSWQKTLSVNPGTVTAVNNIVLYPTPRTATIVASGVVDFWVTAEGIITKDFLRNELLFRKTKIRGTTIAFASDRSATVIATDTLGNYFFIDLETPSAALNITSLFYDLRERSLGLTGTVPITNIAIHPRSDSKVLITSNTSLYLLDTARVSLKLLTSAKTPLRGFSVAGTAVAIIDSHGTVHLTDTVLGRTKLYETDETNAENIQLTSDHNTLLINALGKLTAFSFDEGTAKTLLRGTLQTMTLSPEEKRVLVTYKNGKIAIVYLDDYIDNKPRRAGDVLTLQRAPHAPTLDALRWAPQLPDQMVFIDAGTLTVKEIDDQLPLNGASFAESVVSYAFFGDELYFLTAKGELQSMLFDF